MQATIERYGLDPVHDIPVHGTPGTIEEKLAITAAQVDAARSFCAENAARGSHPLGCPVRWSTTGPIVE
jgi:hypothetical protein